MNFDRNAPLVGPNPEKSMPCYTRSKTYAGFNGTEQDETGRNRLERDGTGPERDATGLERDDIRA